MKMGTNRVLTAHAGSLSRPNSLVALLEPWDGEKPVDLEAFATREPQAPGNAIATRLAARMGLFYDGGQGKNGGSRDVTEQLTGFGGVPSSPLGPADPMDLTGWSIPRRRDLLSLTSCKGPLGWKNLGSFQGGSDNLAAPSVGVKSQRGHDDHRLWAMMTTALSHVIALLLGNEYPPFREAHVEALPNLVSQETSANPVSGSRKS